MEVKSRPAAGSNSAKQLEAGAVPSRGPCCVTCAAPGRRQPVGWLAAHLPSCLSSPCCSLAAATALGDTPTSEFMDAAPWQREAATFHRETREHAAGRRPMASPECENNSCSCGNWQSAGARGQRWARLVGGHRMAGATTMLLRTLVLGICLVSVHGYRQNLNVSINIRTRLNRVVPLFGLDKGGRVRIGVDVAEEGWPRRPPPPCRQRTSTSRTSTASTTCSTVLVVPRPRTPA